LNQYLCTTLYTYPRDIPGLSQESRDTKYSRIHGLPWHGTSQDGPRNPGILSIPGLLSYGTSRDGPRNPGILSKYSRIHGPLTWDIPGLCQESRDTKYSRIHRLPWHGTSRDGPRNPGILSIPRPTGSTHMGHPGMVPGIPGY